MQISEMIRPIYMPTNTALIASDTGTTPPPASPNPTVNPYNTHVDGLITSTIFGGIAGKNMGKLVFNNGQPAGSGLDSVLKNSYLRQAGISAGIGAGVYGGMSVLKQGIGMMSGKQDAAGAAANIITDTLRGGAAGLGASAGGGLTGLAMRAMGMTGTFGTIVTFVGGAIGATVGGSLLEATGAREGLIKAFGSTKAAA
ncbi:hypothetical protein COW36_18215 [bacterium (Candidatus Blackallbacteria) CG17_big_fil_post_rev_8_21_14_2_50_48_46]|uniref:Uncharacterized protein n=1 Tax=bacterium (Candidatus Blackallbacteria) CG17_big_fil_post_rev_8_21_14_2_50_48_46 TaxID=2014261 RepID=A0A2M7G0X0_9BACT|nr:MAG: hypothetical protein COW64_00520 [bacterium (Candidatus Blackallbacteria) CG18_big_fil_WC_8_21_14_2_50_49_26]PIW15351.1 MAG: hypothetical protein COW36_18215 [bacterium (Candidatus Blackallbacteria) CG17_big_fil_post_rev_8_21_14_2_50_48_46]PIW49788.1 MAG: hypothetical protein COW20_05150 [bacterium (Candidatus Blackallbacteria) CG13_big_fil_rev_8_21_14_2_50_49_14]